MPKKKPQQSGASDKDKALSVRVPSDLLEKARDKSKRTGVSISFIIRRALKEWTEAGPMQVGFWYGDDFDENNP